MHAPVVRTKPGAVRGRAEAGLHIFAGVPYAQPPIGPLRWQSPQPVNPWEGEREAVDFGASAWQPYQPGANPIAGDHGEPPFDEDALTLNIWAPAAAGTRRPVLFWIHGGGLLTGSGAVPYYWGDKLARNGDIVVVTINYRLGPFGLLQGLGDSDNIWLDDIAAALHWVSENIESFGGDPEQITVAGQSAGGYAAAALLNHPVGGGLFQRIILQSAPLGWAPLTRDQARERTESVARNLGLDDIEGLRAMPPEAILGATLGILATYGRFGEYNVPLLPVADEHSLPISPAEAAATTDLDVLIGWTEDEMTLAFALDPQYARVPKEAVVGWAAQHSENPEALYEAYAEGGRTPLEVLSAVYSDELFRKPSLAVAKSRADNGRPTYAYEFQLDSPAAGGSVGSMHTIELPFVFDAVERHTRGSELLSGIDSATVQRVTDQMHRAWIAFVRSGRPDSEASTWPPHTASSPQIMVIDSDSRPVDAVDQRWTRVR